MRKSFDVIWKVALPLLIMLAFQGCFGGKPPKKEPAPDFTFQLFDGGVFRSADYKGKPMVINFWASWCGPCRIEAPLIENSYQQFRKKGVGYLGIATQDTREKALEFVKEYGLTFPLGIDESEELSKAFGVLGLPTTFIIDGEGMIRYTHLGGITEELLTNEIEKYL